MRPALLLLSAALLAFTFAPARADDAPKMTGAAGTLTDAQRAEVQEVIKDYLTKTNPEVLIEASRVLQEREQVKNTQDGKEAVSNNKDKIFNDPNSPSVGNPKGDVTVVEFFDFNCGYCKMAEPVVERLIKEDKSVKLIYKDYPILGPVSLEASKAAIASIKQGKYQPFHDAMMTSQNHLTSDVIYKTAKDVGLDVAKLKKDMEDPSVMTILETNSKLGQEIGARGTPTFVIGKNVFPGALQYDQLKKAVDDSRTASAK